MAPRQSPQRQRTTETRSADDERSDRAAAGPGEQLEVQEDDERDEDLDEVKLMLALAQMDSEAASAYESAAALVSADDVRTRLVEFAADHRRHISDIKKLVEKLGVAAAFAAPAPELSLFAIMARAMTPLGDDATLMALQISEEYTNGTYATMAELATNPEAAELLRRNLEDERRHLEWLSDRVGIPDDEED